MGNACQGSQTATEVIHEPRKGRWETDESETTSSTTEKKRKHVAVGHVAEGGPEVFVCHEKDFVSRSRVVSVRTREIAVWKHHNGYFSLDNACYHHGAPLSNGDIEDFDGKSCIVCPWHGYRITLESGEGLYWGLSEDLQSKCVKSKGIKQRAHDVIVRDGKIYVKVNVDGASIASDFYASSGPAAGGAGGSIHSSMPKPKKEMTLQTSLPNTMHSDASSKSPATAPLLPDDDGDTLGETPILLAQKVPVNTSETSLAFTFELVTTRPEMFAGRGLGYPGQHAVLALDVDGVRVTRSWTVVSRPSATSFEVIVKKKPDGVASPILHDKAEVGSSFILVGVFRGSFGMGVNMPPVPPLAKHVYLFSGGIGITPMLACINLLLGNGGHEVITTRTRPLLEFTATLIHVEKNVDSIASLDLIEAFAATGRMTGHIFLTGTSSIPEDVKNLQYYSGRPRFLDVCDIVKEQDCHAYICGPEGFFMGVKDQLNNLPTPFDFDLIFTEAFD